MVIGYLRVSTGKQHPANQKNEIIRFAKGRGLKVEKWVTEIVSGKTKGSYTKTGILIRNRDEIIGLIESRMPVRRICELYGVSRDTFARFRKEFIVRHSGDGTGLPRP